MSAILTSGPEFLVNTTTDRAQFLPSLTGLADGRFVVSWTDASSTGGDQSGWAVRAQIFNADASPAGAEFLVNTTTTYGQFSPRTTALEDGRFVVTWSDSSSLASGGSSTAAIQAQIFNADGTRSGPEFLVNTTMNSTQYNPSITTLANGGFVVAWEDNSKTGADTLNQAVRAQVFNPDASPAGGEFLANSTTTNGQHETAVAALSNGRFVITWRDDSASGDDTSGAAIRAQIFNADGSLWGGEFLVNTTTDRAQTDPAISALSDGRFVVSWTDLSASGDDTSGAAIRAQIFTADGARSGAEFVVNTATFDAQSDSQITTLTDGRFVISWSDMGQTGDDTTDSAIRAQVFNADGTKAGSAVLVNTITANAQTESTLSALADGRFVVSWSDNSKSAGDTWQQAVRAQIFDPREAAVNLTGTGLGDDFVGTGFGDEMSGRSGDDTLSGRGGRDFLAGNTGDDTLKGGAGRDKLSGGLGNDLLTGGKNGDRLLGGDGNDAVVGGGGRDKIIGGLGQDDQTGGAGADRFIFNAADETGKTKATRDTIRDFNQTQGDLIDLSGIDASDGPGNQAFTFIGGAEFSGTKGELRFSQGPSKTVIRGDIDGDGTADFSIALDGVISLTAGDFIL